MSWLVFSYYSNFFEPQIRSAGEHTEVSASVGGPLSLSADLATEVIVQ